MAEEKSKDQNDKVKMKFVARTPMEAQRVKLEKLMSDPTKPVIIPTTKQKKDFANAIPSFIRNVMGSSAGAGSGEFHVYRHLRRKEYARQKHIQQKSKQETLDDEYQQKLDNNRIQSEEKTAKKRAKRLKKKQNAKNKAKMPKIDPSSKCESDGEDEDEEEEEDKEENKIVEDKTDVDNGDENKQDVEKEDGVKEGESVTNEVTSEKEGTNNLLDVVASGETEPENKKEVENVTDVTISEEVTVQKDK